MSMKPLSRREARGFDDALDLARDFVATAVHQARSAKSRFRVARFNTGSVFADQPWRLGVGIVSVLVPAAVLAILAPDASVTTPGVVLLVAIAFSTYLADLVGGITSLVLSTLLLDLFFIGSRSDLGAPAADSEGTAFVITLLSGGVLIWLIQRIKLESKVDRRAAVAARAAAAALASVEAAVASHARGSMTSRSALNRSLLRAMVSINRGHFGVLLLTNAEDNDFYVAATYGFDGVDRPPRHASDISEHLIERIAMERRSRHIFDLASRPTLVGPALAAIRARAVIGVPLFDTDDRMLGIAVVGLLVPYRFTQTEIARLDALAARASAVLDAAVGIDERENALNSATSAKRWLERVIAMMPEAVVLAVPPDGRIVAENQAAVDLLGQLLGPEADGEILSRLSLPDGSPVAPESWPIRTAFETGNVVTGVEMVAHSPGGSAVPVLVSAAPVHEGDGQIVAVVTVFRNITSLKEASRLKDEFVSVVSHELRSPLTPIRGFVQLVAKDLAREGGHDAQVSRLHSIAGHVDRMTRLVDDLLDVSRLKSGTLEIRRQFVDLADLSEDVVRDRTATTSSHKFAFQRPEESIQGDWDPDRLYQVMDNLVGNAIKYSPPGGTITVSTGIDRDRGEATVTVADDGPGIGPEERERVFSAFYRTPDAEASHIAGLGLGLYICHELVAAHEGTIDVGDGPTGGAAFTIRLPLVTPAFAA